MIKLYIFWIIGLFILTFLGTLLLPLNANTGLGSVAPGKNINYFLSLAQWDGGHFLEIAKNGYKSPESLAFFPLYPFLIYLITAVTNNEIIASLIISNSSLVIFLIFFKKYLAKITSAKIASNTVITFLFFPTTFFCALLYSESLFLMLTILAFFQISERKYVKFSIITWLATLTRLNGVFIPIAVIFSNKISKNKKAILALASLVPVVLYFFSISIFSKNPFAPITVQAMWNRELSDPISTLFSYIWAFLTGEKRPINDYFDFIVTASFVVLLVKNIKKIPLDLWIFSACVIALPLYTGTLTSMPRYALTSIGVYLIIAKIISKNENIKYVFWSVSLFIQCILAALFINGHWIA